MLSILSHYDILLIIVGALSAIIVSSPTIYFILKRRWEERAPEDLVKANKKVKELQKQIKKLEQDIEVKDNLLFEHKLAEKIILQTIKNKEDICIQ